MENETETIEVNPDELSDEVISGLVEEGDLDKEVAAEFGEEAWFDEIEGAEPEKTTGLSYLRNRYESVKSISSATVSLFKEYKTAYAEVKSVDRYRKNQVKITFHNSRVDSNSIRFNKESKALANLLEYKGVENPKDLEGSKILLNGDNALLIPHNVSTSGRVRFRLYSMTEEVREKTLIRSLSGQSGEFAEMMLVLALPLTLLGTASMIALTISTIVFYILFLPIAIWAVVLLFSIAYGVIRSALLIISKILDSEFYEKHP